MLLALSKREKVHQSWSGPFILKRIIEIISSFHRYISICDTGISLLNNENELNTSRKSSPYLETFYSKGMNMRNPFLSCICFSLGGKLTLIMKPACRRAGENSQASWLKLTGSPKFLEQQGAMQYCTQVRKLQVRVVQCCDDGPALVLPPLPATWISLISICLGTSWLFFGGIWS